MTSPATRVAVRLAAALGVGPNNVRPHTPRGGGFPVLEVRGVPAVRLPRVFHGFPVRWAG